MLPNISTGQSEPLKADCKPPHEESRRVWPAFLIPHEIAHVQSYHHTEGLLDSAFLSIPAPTPVLFLPVIVEAAVQLSGEVRVEAVTVLLRITGVWHARCGVRTAPGDARAGWWSVTLLLGVRLSGRVGWCRVAKVMSCRTV